MSQGWKPLASQAWVDDIESALRDETRNLLKDYAGVSVDEVVDHIDKTVSNIAPS